MREEIKKAAIERREKSGMSKSESFSEEDTWSDDDLDNESNQSQHLLNSKPSTAVKISGNKCYSFLKTPSEICTRVI